MSHNKVNRLVFITPASTDLFGFSTNFGRICNQYKQYLQILANVYSKILPWLYRTGHLTQRSLTPKPRTDSGPWVIWYRATQKE